MGHKMPFMCTYIDSRGRNVFLCLPVTKQFQVQLLWVVETSLNNTLYRQGFFNSFFSLHVSWTIWVISGWDNLSQNKSLPKQAQNVSKQANLKYITKHASI